MGEWRRVALGAVAEEVTVGHVGSMTREYRESGIPFLRSQNVLPHRVDLDDVKFIDEDFHGRLGKSALAPGDVITVRTGKPGTSAVVPDWLKIANCADLVITRPGPDLDSKWLSYYLNFVTDAEIAQHLVGAVQQHFNVGSAKALVLALPEVAEQRAIAAVLSSFDDKIAANKGLISSAESLMLAVVASISGCTTVSELANQSTRSVKPDRFDDVVAHYSLPAFDTGSDPELVRGSSIMSNKFLMSRPSVLFSKLNPRIPRIWDVVAPPPQMSLASTEFVVLEPSNLDSSALWAAMAQPEVSEELRQKVAGTSGSHQRIRPSDLLGVRVRDVRMLDELSASLVKHLGRACHERRQESSRLVRARDELLPLLMSGRVTVKAAEQIVGDLT